MLSRCAVVIPCLNEAEHIGSLLRAVQRRIASVIVVDDGSDDGTGGLAAQAGAEVIRHEAPKGKGAALHAGWRRARQRGFLWALTMDGDEQHSPEDIPAFLECAQAGQAVLIVGNRMEKSGEMPWLRRQVNRWMSRQLSAMAGRSLPDTQCGYRMIHLESLARLTLKTAHFEIESEVILAFAAAGYPIEFIPVQVIYKGEASKIRPVSDTWRWFRWRSVNARAIGTEGHLRARKNIRDPK